MKLKPTTYILIGMLIFGAVAPAALTAAFYAIADKQPFAEYMLDKYGIDVNETEIDTVVYENTSTVEISKTEAEDLTGAEITVSGKDIYLQGKVELTIDDTLKVVIQH